MKVASAFKNTTAVSLILGAASFISYDCFQLTLRILFEYRIDTQQCDCTVAEAEMNGN